ncbi:SIR2 family protein [Gilvimarinus chinensis]|uniref:SIR2 family protein n=1 Tax=Gilvimarinus chinensis TaxID=396005 RepID=UPI0003A92F23|nr:SIR2 family protein [Gilvimarinus chinensis]
MKFYSDGPNIPDILLDQCDAGRVVFLCGAGVSLPSGMPDFIGLTQYVIDFFDPPESTKIKSSFQPWVDDPASANMPLDQIFNLLHQEYGKDEVNALVSERLSKSLKTTSAGREHDLIKRISSSKSGRPQVVTTNFDRLFEIGLSADELSIHIPPRFPDITLGIAIEGITYLHGRLVDANAEHHPYVLSSADFGRAYLAEGWATNFVRNLLKSYTVVLVGYKAEDPPIKYLLQGLNHDGQYDSSRLYAFDRGLKEDIEAKWRDRGVTAIAYSDHTDLWKTMEAWANRADDPRLWREGVIATAQRDPKSMAPYQRGQVAHAVRNSHGSKLFLDADPTPHPEWVCVFDTEIRTAQPFRGLGNDDEQVDPKEIYGLDGDEECDSQDNLFRLRVDDEIPNESISVSGGLFGASESLPARLKHLNSWIVKSVHSPVTAWWIAQKSGLHPELLRMLESKVLNDAGLHPRACHIWNLILEHHQERYLVGRDDGWFNLRKKIVNEGWSGSVLRYISKAFKPRLAVSSLYNGFSPPPTMSWDKVSLRDIGQFEVKFPVLHDDKLEVPDELLPQVCNILCREIAVASNLLTDVNKSYFNIPTLYPGRESTGTRYFDEGADFIIFFVQLFERLCDLHPQIANAHASLWLESDKYFFRKLKLYALSKTQVFSSDSVAKNLLSFSQEAFWDRKVARELLFLIEDRWDKFKYKHKIELTERLLAGPDQPDHISKGEYTKWRDCYAGQYTKYLELKGCHLLKKHKARLNAIIKNIPNWTDEAANCIVFEHGARAGWISRNEEPGNLLNTPLCKIIPTAEADSGSDFYSFSEKRPFTGLVKAKPQRALSALTLAGKSGNYPYGFWTSFIQNLPDNCPIRLQRVFLHRLSRLPFSVVIELRDDLSRWLDNNFISVLELDEGLGWSVYDHIVDGILSGGAEATTSGIGASNIGDEVVERSRRTHDHALYGCLGFCTEALYKVADNDTTKEGSLIPEHIKVRLERLLSAPGEGSDHAVTITMIKLNRLMYIDPSWTETRILPMLAFDNPMSEPAWNGLLHSGRVPWTPLARLIKPFLVNIFPWINQFSWAGELSIIAAQWIGHLHIFCRDKTHGISNQEMRSALRSMSDNCRNQFIYWLGDVGQTKINGWNQLVIPFLKHVWPRERKLRTSTSVRAWIGLLDDTDEQFPEVYIAIKPFLAPVESAHQFFYRFTREISGQRSLNIRFPETTLDLVDTVTPHVLHRPLYELSSVLSSIAEANPRLAADFRYLRLIDLVERS